VTRPRVSDVINKKAVNFTIDALVDMMAVQESTSGWLFNNVGTLGRACYRETMLRCPP